MSTNPGSTQGNPQALNAICAYFTMFPLAFPLGVLQQHAEPGQWVLDPFCGRGTTNFAGRLLGLPSIGIDSHPLAVALSEAKLISTTPGAIVRAARHILDAAPPPTSLPQNDFWTLAYHSEVLYELCRLREALCTDCRSAARKALRAVILGALHGPLTNSTPSYFSNQMPRTFAPKPDYSVKFWREHNLFPPEVDLLKVIETRARRYFTPNLQPARGHIIQGDSRQSSSFTAISQPANWIITSPPYYGMRTYLPDQWLRLWFLGGPPHVDYSNRRQLEHSSPEHFASNLRRVWTNTAAISTQDARLVIRFGGINDRHADPLEIIRSSLSGTGWSIDAIYPAGSASQGRRQALHFGRQSSAALEELDLWATRT